MKHTSQQVEQLSDIPLTQDLDNSEGTPANHVRSLRALSGKLAKLERAVDGGADADPGPDARASYATLSTAATATLQSWNQLRNDGLTKLNAQLKAAGDKPITL